MGSLGSQTITQVTIAEGNKIIKITYLAINASMLASMNGWCPFCLGQQKTPDSNLANYDQVLVLSQDRYEQNN